jgi:hypothetical protein
LDFEIGGLKTLQRPKKPSKASRLVFLGKAFDGGTWKPLAAIPRVEGDG